MVVMINIKKFFQTKLGFKRFKGLRPTRRTRQKLSKKNQQEAGILDRWLRLTHSPSDQADQMSQCVESNSTKSKPIKFTVEDTNPKDAIAGPKDASAEVRDIKAKRFSKSSAFDLDETPSEKDWLKLTGKEFDQAFEQWFDILTDNIELPLASKGPILSLVASNPVAHVNQETRVSIACVTSSVASWEDQFDPQFLQLHWADGRTFKGMTLAMMPDGYGIMRWPSGRKYQGEFRMGLPHGHGTLIHANGNLIKGHFYNGRLPLALAE